MGAMILTSITYFHFRPHINNFTFVHASVRLTIKSRPKQLKLYTTTRCSTDYELQRTYAVQTQHLPGGTDENHGNMSGQSVFGSRHEPGTS